jgi:hypothetical protein
MSVISPIVISEFYLDELDSRKTCLQLFLDEIEDCQQLLNQILHYNTAGALAEKIERNSNRLFLSKQHLLDHRHGIREIEEELYDNDIPVNDSQITAKMDSEMSRLRQEALKIESNFLLASTDCREFMAQVMSRQRETKN